MDALTQGKPPGYEKKFNLPFIVDLPIEHGDFP
jgi:hypothetical protein